MLADATGRLEYTIRFQNTGNDTAYRVVILTRSPPLNLTTVPYFTLPPPYQFKVLPTLLMFVFENINLPDSTTNLGEPGQVQFSIHPDPDIPPGDRHYQPGGDLLLTATSPLLLTKRSSPSASSPSLLHR